MGRKFCLWVYCDMFLTISSDWFLKSFYVVFWSHTVWFDVMVFCICGKRIVLNSLTKLYYSSFDSFIYKLVILMVLVKGEKIFHFVIQYIQWFSLSVFTKQTRVINKFYEKLIEICLRYLIINRLYSK